MTSADTRVMSAPLPVAPAEQGDELAARLERSRDWVVKQALATYVEREAERHRLTLEAHLRQGARTEAAVAASQPDKGAAAAPGVAVDAPATSPLLLTLQLDGAYTQAGEASQWNVRIPAFLLRPTAPATTAPREEALPLLEARDLRLAWRRAGPSESWTLEPGRLQGLGASLTWREARWWREGDRRELALDGDVEPFAVAPGSGCAPLPR